MELKEKFDSQILEKIKEEKLKPKARWTFLLKDYVIWAFGFVSLIIGSLSIAVLIYLIGNNDWSIYSEISDSLLEFIILTLPYYWFLFLAIFIVVINYNIKHTKKGYKYSLPVIITASVLASMFLGIIFSSAGLGSAIDDVFAENVVYYDRFINPTINIWDHPEDGRLAGLIVAQVDDCQYYLVDIRQNEWLINMVEVEQNECDKVEVGRPIKMLGTQEGDFYFVVEKIIYHDGPGREFIKKKPMDMMDDENMGDMMEDFFMTHDIPPPPMLDDFLKMQESTSTMRIDW